MAKLQNPDRRQIVKITAKVAAWGFVVGVIAVGGAEAYVRTHRMSRAAQAITVGSIFVVVGIIFCVVVAINARRIHNRMEAAEKMQRESGQEEQH